MAAPPTTRASTPRRVLLVIEEAALSDLLAEALVDAGHTVAQAADAADARRAADAERFDAAVVDLDTRARDGAALVAALRAAHPPLTLIALLPCGGLQGDPRPAPYHVAVEKPARLGALLAAVDLAAAAIRN